MDQSQQKYVVIGLAVVVLVLAGVIGYMVVSAQSQPEAASVGASSTNTGQTGTGATGGTAAQGASQEPASFDPKTATKVPAGTTPEAFVKEYYEAVTKKDYATAFTHLPADKQAGSSAEALKQQLEGYGITGYEVTKATEQDGKFVVDADQITQSYGTFANSWVFVKNGNVWVVQSKAVTGMK